MSVISLVECNGTKVGDIKTISLEADLSYRWRHYLGKPYEVTGMWSLDPAKGDAYDPKRVFVKIESAEHSAFLTLDCLL